MVGGKRQERDLAGHPVRAAGLFQPGIPPVSAMASRRGSYTPGLPITVWVTRSRGTPASAQMSSASLTSSATRPGTLDAAVLSEDLARISPDRSASAPRRNWCPMSRPSTKPASGRTSYSSAERPGPPVRWPASRTSAARSRLASASDTVGLDRPETRARSAREYGPENRMCSSSSCSFMALISGGRAA